ncbi:MAG: neutral zinc metallopeptidase [Bacteroidales bacterium]|nr:neutral zinc metallopeptidase [Bacteroidales bacterium]
MKLDGRRVSDNVDDRRGSRRTLKAGGLGLGGIIIIGLIAWLMGGDPAEVVNQVTEMSTTTPQTEYIPSPEEEALATFSAQILASTEDVWGEIFRKNGHTYIPPKLVLYTDQVTSGCGGASAECGPFYCSADQSVYIDLSFFMNMKQQLGADGDFAYAYVIAHEVGHHVQYLLGTLQQAHSQMRGVTQKQANEIMVRLELQADFYAGIWAHHEHRRYQSLEDGDIEEGINAASKIGDDYLQKKARGYSVPDSFTHGTSAQRMRWLKKGITTGRISDGDTFSPAYSSL